MINRRQVSAQESCNNRIGRRIVGIGRVDTGSGASINNDVPDTYELPRVYY